VGLNPHGIKVRSNRGVAGIDGTVSTAIGAALANEGSHESRNVATEPIACKDIKLRSD
jgi:2-succinyl-5-enolpyruvyl-6-hydroxy-3-cyclohexene-1-carboxylate synthase